MAIRDVSGRPVIGYFSFTPYPAPVARPVIRPVIDPKAIQTAAKKRIARP